MINKMIKIKTFGNNLNILEGNSCDPRILQCWENARKCPDVLTFFSCLLHDLIKAKLQAVAIYNDCLNPLFD